jgi:hypothetical protein
MLTLYTIIVSYSSSKSVQPYPLGGIPMYKHILLIIMLPTFLMGMQGEIEPKDIDPRTIHDPCERPMWKQAAELAGKRAWKNKEVIAGFTVAAIKAAQEIEKMKGKKREVHTILYPEQAQELRHQEALQDAIDNAEELNSDLEFLPGQSRNNNLPEPGCRRQEMPHTEDYTGQSPEVVIAKGGIAITVMVPIEVPTKVAVIGGLIGGAGLVKLGRETYNWVSDVLDAKDRKEAFIASKAKAIEAYDKRQEEKERLRLERENQKEEQIISTREEMTVRSMPERYLTDDEVYYRWERRG